MGKYVSDAVVDVLRELGVKYVPLNPGSSFRGLHDSLVNYGGGEGDPQILLVTHEEIAISMAHAYAKATGDTAYAIIHDLVGLMHASMGIYDAWCDHTPMVVLGGGGPADPAARNPIDWFHSANVQSAIVRPFVKWDDDPITPQAILDGIVQAHRMASSAPQAPTYVTIDAHLQEQEAADDLVSRAAEGLAAIDPPFVAAAADVAKAVDALMSAEQPVVIAGRVGLDPESTPLMVELSELLGAANRDERNHSALPTNHQLNLNGDAELIDEADVLLCVDLHDVLFVLNTRKNKAETPTVIDLSTNSLAIRSWANTGNGFRPADVRLVSDPKLGLQALIDGVRARVEAETGDAKARRADRAAALAERHSELRKKQRAAVEARWDETPIAVPRLVAEVYEAVKDEPWLLTLRNTRSWPEGIWEFDRAGRYLGHSGGGGIGYGPGAMVGGALAARERGEFAVGIIGDGDLMFAPGAIWTAVAYDVPMLIVVNNNQSYFNDEQHQVVVAKHRNRPVENAHIGTANGEPAIDFGAIARAQGAWAPEEPIIDPNDIKPALDAAIAQVKQGKVALIDVRTSTR